MSVSVYSNGTARVFARRGARVIHAAQDGIVDESIFRKVDVGAAV
jgi:hypothetical protein